VPLKTHACKIFMGHRNTKGKNSFYLDREGVNTTKVKFETMYIYYWSFLQLCTWSGKKWWRQSPYTAINRHTTCKTREKVPLERFCGVDVDRY
jgi:hypothetical protein